MNVRSHWIETYARPDRDARITLITADGDIHLSGLDQVRTLATGARRVAGPRAAGGLVPREELAAWAWTWG